MLMAIQIKENILPVHPNIWKEDIFPENLEQLNIYLCWFILTSFLFVDVLP